MKGYVGQSITSTDIYTTPLIITPNPTPDNLHKTNPHDKYYNEFKWLKSIPL